MADMDTILKRLDRCQILISEGYQSSFTTTGQSSMWRSTA
jgi:hypothetical protein